MGLELHITAGGPQLRVPTWPDVALAAEANPKAGHRDSAPRALVGSDGRASKGGGRRR
jgi:hypothetical protein